MKDISAFPIPFETHNDGMTLHQYAAIKLKIPDSGTDWLDEMIRQSLRNDFAAQAMQGLIASPRGLLGKNEITDADYAQVAYLVADAMLKAREA